MPHRTPETSLDLDNIDYLTSDSVFLSTIVDLEIQLPLRHHQGVCAEIHLPQPVPQNVEATASSNFRC
jgi:hypothetical protein